MLKSLIVAGGACLLSACAAPPPPVIPGPDEANAKLCYQEGYELLVKKRDNRGADAKFRECLEKYSTTEYMKSKVPPSHKTRIEIAEGLLRMADR